jgi:diketogulonate reductase-like aldo/keto reductase
MCQRHSPVQNNPGSQHRQFYWQDYSDHRYISALQCLANLKDEGYISAIGLCNFDAVRTDEICTQLGPGVVVSNQVQVSALAPSNRFLTYLTLKFSLIDTRPLHGMSDVCQKHDLKLLTYGTLVGCVILLLIADPYRFLSAVAICQINGSGSQNQNAILTLDKHLL